MANLRVRMKDGSEREMTQKVFDLLGHKRKPHIIGKVESTAPVSEIEKIKADLRAQKAANTIAEPTLTLPKISELPQESKADDVVIEKKKPGPKPKSKE